MIPEHPTEADLELARTGEVPGDVAAHLETCAACRARMDRIEALATVLGPPLAPLPIPPERERDVIELARERAAAIRQAARPRRALRRLAWAGPLAAAAALVLVLLLPERRPPETTLAREAAAPANPADFNRDGRVDILDALAVALAIEAGRDDAAYDANRDGRVDRGDVDRIAAAAVAIGPAGAGGAG